MTELEIRTNIANLILKLERPFNLSDLFIECKNRLGIENRECILDVLEELCDAGVVSYSEIRNDCWAYSSCA